MSILESMLRDSRTLAAVCDPASNLAMDILIMLTHLVRSFYFKTEIVGSAGHVNCSNSCHSPTYQLTSCALPVLLSRLLYLLWYKISRHASCFMLSAAIFYSANTPGTYVLIIFISKGYNSDEDLKIVATQHSCLWAYEVHYLQHLRSINAILCPNYRALQLVKDNLPQQLQDHTFHELKKVLLPLLSQRRLVYVNCRLMYWLLSVCLQSIWDACVVVIWDDNVNHLHDIKLLRSCFLEEDSRDKQAARRRLEGAG